MIKMKNILAENMIRFGVKNLSESDKQNLQEQIKDEYFQKAINDIIAFANTKVTEVKTKNPKSRIQPFSFIRVELPAEKPAVAYKIKWGSTFLSWNGDDLALNIMLPAKNIISAISAYFDPKTSNNPFGKTLNSSNYSATDREILKTIQPQAVKIFTQAFGIKPNPVKP